MAEFKLEDWFPMSPLMGPPLPKWMGITWPWCKVEVPPGEPPPEQLGYDCPYCDQSFATLNELIQHIRDQHPDKPPIQEIEIQWV